MKFIDKIFGRKSGSKNLIYPEEDKSNNNIQPNEKEVEEVRNIGLSGDALKSVIIERMYMAEHPCKCGGSWERIGGGSAFPQYVYSDCECTNCGAKKEFIFYF